MVWFATCRCSREDKTVPSTSTATGPATRKNSATSKANSGLVGHTIYLLILRAYKDKFLNTAYFWIRHCTIK